jgi:hypothetical protein
MMIKPLESDVERVYASIRVALERKGMPIDRRGIRDGQGRCVQTSACSES